MTNYKLEAHHCPLTELATELCSQQRGGEDKGTEQLRDERAGTHTGRWHEAKDYYRQREREREDGRGAEKVKCKYRNKSYIR